MFSVAFLWDVIFAHERRTLRQNGAVSPCKTCVRRSHAALFPNKNMSWQLGEGTKRWEWFHQTVRARPHRESCLFGDDVVDATHLVWLVGCVHCLFLRTSPWSVWCVFSPGKLLFYEMCLRDCSAEATRGFATVAIGLFHVEVVTS